MGGKARKERPKIKVKTEWQKIESSRRFPRCNGIYDDCPPKEELEKVKAGVLALGEISSI